MTTTDLMILLLACVVAVFIGVALVTWWEIRQEMAWRDRWLSMPGATDNNEPPIYLHAYQRGNAHGSGEGEDVFDWSENP